MASDSKVVVLNKNTEKIIEYTQVFGAGVKIEYFFLGNAGRAVFVARVVDDLVARHCQYSPDDFEFKHC